MIPELIHTFEASMRFLKESVDDIPEQHMVQQPPGAPNHGMWTLGHIVYSCHAIAVELGAEAWLPHDWEAAFGYGSKPSLELSSYLKKSEMLRRLEDAAGRLREALLSASEPVLNRPLQDETMPTMTHLLLQVVIAHTAYHAGQMAVWRRALGKEPAGVFV